MKKKVTKPQFMTYFNTVCTTMNFDYLQKKEKNMYKFLITIFPYLRIY